MTPTTRRLAGLVVACLAATTLAGCAQIQTWTDQGPVGAAPSPAASATSASPSESPSTDPTPSQSASTTQTPSPTQSASSTASPSETPSATPSPSETPTASETPSPSPTPTESATPTASPSSTPSPTPTPTKTTPSALRYGDSGPEVRAVQRRLVELGYWLGVRDASFGPLTQQAVFAFQKSAGLQRDGVVGPKTRTALKKGIRPKPRLKGNGIEIDLDRQILMVVRKGKPTVVLNTSTGNGEEYTSSAGNQAIATTPTGRFEVFRGVDGKDDSDLGELWRPRYFHRGYAVHGSPAIPPYPASHGCARISDDAIDMIWDRGLMPIGATVLVH